MAIRCFFIIALLASFQAIGGQAAAPHAIRQWAVLASRSNLAGASQAELQQCLEFLPKQLDLISYDDSLPESTPSYVALVSWGVGWLSMSLNYAAVDDRGKGVVIFDQGEGSVRQKVPASDVQALVSRLSRLHERYSVIPGVQDGGCELLVISAGMGTRSALLPPGGEVSSEQGDPRDILRAWVDQRLSTSP